MKPKIYLAAPLFNPNERAFNARLELDLRVVADVFLPQRDGNLLTQLLAAGAPLEAARRQIYEADTAALAECDIVVAVLDGRTVDEGVAFELGFGRALGKACIAFKSDDRNLLLTGDNPMIVGACVCQCGTVEAVVEAIRELAGKSIRQAGRSEEAWNCVVPPADRG